MPVLRSRSVNALSTQDDLGIFCVELYVCIELYISVMKIKLLL